MFRNSEPSMKNIPPPPFWSLSDLKVSCLGKRSVGSLMTIPGGESDTLSESACPGALISMIGGGWSKGSQGQSSSESYHSFLTGSLTLSLDSSLISLLGLSCDILSALSWDGWGDSGLGSLCWIIISCFCDFSLWGGANESVFLDTSFGVSLPDFDDIF